jgi:OOP family OmpA-OmpF porin
MQCALIATAAFAGSANAQYYGGLTLDPTRLNGVTNVSTLPTFGFHIANPALEDSRIRYGLKLGYQLNSNFSLVGNYSQYEKSFNNALSAPNSLAWRPATRSTGLDLVGTVPLFERFSVSGSAGLVRMRGDAIFDGVGRPFTAGKLGVGMQYNFSKSLGLRLDLARYRNLGASAPGENDADNFSFGVMLKF